MTDLINLLQQAAANSERLVLKHTGLPTRHLQILRIVQGNPGIRTADLSRAANLDRGNASWFFKALLKDGLLRDKVADGDARQRQFWTTAKANRRIAAAEAPYKAIEFRIANQAAGPLSQTALFLTRVSEIGGDDENGAAKV